MVQDLNNSLIAMKQTIIRSVDNLIVGLNIKIKNIRAQEEQTSRRISAVPTQQKEVLSVERRQKIKEELYLYLLNKREENELTQRMTESNARIIDPAAGSNAPVAPKSMMILLASIVLGCAIPAGQRHEGALAEGCGGGTLRAVPGRDPDARQEGQERGGGA